MRNLESLGKSLTKKDLKHISGGLDEGGWTATCTGTSESQGQHLCDYHIVWPNGRETDSCEQGCWSECNTLGSVCYF